MSRKANHRKENNPCYYNYEANSLLTQTINDFKMLLNFNMDSKDRAILLLVGQESLKNTLNLSYNEAIRQRVSMNYTLIH